MWKKITSKSTQATIVKKINNYWEIFLSFHETICENDRSEIQKSASSYSQIQGLSEIIKILIEEDKIPSETRTLKPCMEYLITSRFFEILTAAAQTDLPEGLLSYVIKLYKKIFKHIQNQDFIPQMSFHSSLSSLLHVLSSLAPLPQKEINIQIIKLLESILLHIYKSSALLELFTYRDEKSEKLLPMSILMIYFNDDTYLRCCKAPLFIISKIKSVEIVKIVIESHELGLNFITKLIFYFQTRQIEPVKYFSNFLQEFYANCACKQLQEEIIDAFYENFCVLVLTPRLQSNEASMRMNASLFLTLILEEISSLEMLLIIVYYFQGKGKDGNKRVKSFVSTPTNSQVKSFVFDKGCKPLSDLSQMWGTLIENLNSEMEQLARYTLKIFYLLLNQGGKKVVKLLVTDYFTGSPPTDEVSITAEIFLSLVPHSIIPRDNKNYLGDYLNSGYIKCSHALSSSSFNLHEYSEHTGAQSYQTKTGETGGTEPNLISVHTDPKQKFFEGELLQSILSKFKNFLNNSMDENLYITGIISTLSAFPKEIGSFSALHNFLLEPQTSSKKSFLSCLKELSMEIDSIISSDKNYNDKLSSTVSDMGIESKNVSEYFYGLMGKKAKKSKSLDMEDKKYIEAIIVFQEFIKEMVSILIFKELLSNMDARANVDDEDV